MAKSTNLFLALLSGSLGKLVTVKQYKSGKVVVCQKIGKRKKEGSAAQLENEERFKRANALAKKIYKDPLKREEARLRLNVPHGTELYCAILQEFRHSEAVNNL